MRYKKKNSTESAVDREREEKRKHKPMTIGNETICEPKTVNVLEIGDRGHHKAKAKPVVVVLGKKKEEEVKP